MIKVKVNLGKTINLGNYESLRVDIGVEIDGDNREALFKEAYDFCASKIKVIESNMPARRPDTWTTGL